MKNKNTELITEFWKALNKREYSVIDKICSSNIIARSYGISRSNVNNINEWKNEIEHLFNSFPDYFLEIHKIVAEGNEV